MEDKNEGKRAAIGCLCISLICIIGAIADDFKTKVIGFIAMAAIFLIGAILTED